MNLEFPLCRQPLHEVPIRQALATCVSVLTDRLPASDLVAVILTGSFARGEGTVLPRGDGLKILGDLEFFVILARSPDERLRRMMPAWAREARARLAAAGVRVDVEFGPLGLPFLRRAARPSIFVYDLRRHGKVLWGNSELLHLIPPFGAETIPREDAVYLLFNRVIEQLATWERIGGLRGEALIDAAYQRLKLTLDLAGSALALAGMHTALYRERPGAFRRLVAETPSLEASLPSGLIDDLALAGRAKADPTGYFDGLGAAAALEEQRTWLRRRMLSAVPVVAAVLRWELEQLLEQRDELPALLARWARTPSFRQRAWDWAKLVLNPLPAPLPLSHLRAARLFWRSTPRALLYLAASRAYFALEREGPALDDVWGLLPLPATVRSGDAAVQRRSIVTLWQWGIRNR